MLTRNGHAIRRPQRRPLLTVLALVLLVAAGELVAAVMVHRTLLGADGHWTRYLVEPLMFALLSVWMMAPRGRRRRPHLGGHQ